MRLNDRRPLWMAGAAIAALVATAPASAAVSYVNTIVLPGESTDLFPTANPGVNTNRLSTGSDLWYDRFENVFYGLADRGPGGGTISFDTRAERFTLDVNQSTGAIGNFQLRQTVPFRQGTAAFNGLNPRLLNGNAAILGKSFDPEGIAVGKNGNLFVSDEYGPSVYEFTKQGQFVRALTTPANIVPRQSGSTINYVDGRPTIVNGRQDNRGFEGLTVSPDGSKLYAALQDPLVNEGTNSGSADGRRSRNLRIVEFDVATGQPGKQFIYRLESLSDINARVPGSEFASSAQGRNIGISSITAINDHQFLLIERDNRGLGVDETVNGAPKPPVASKRIYLIDTTGATDVSGISLDNTNSLPPGVTAVSKTLFLDVQKALEAAGVTIPEKLEGLTIGPRLADGSYLLLLGTDNDFSVTQNSSGVQFNVCLNGTQVALADACASGTSLIPSFLYAFKADLPGYVAPVGVPEPVAISLFALGVAGLAAARRRG